MLYVLFFQTGNFTYGKVLIVSNLTKFYANKTIQWANTSLVSANKTAYEFIIRTNKTAYEILILTNKTMREVVIPFVNQTARDLIVLVNRTRFQPWNVTLNETLTFLNRTSVVLRNKANETYLVLQDNAIKAWQNLTSEESIAKMKAYLNMTKTRAIAGLRAANETIFMLRNKTVRFIIYIRDETPLLNMTKKYALLARNFTLTSINQARNMTQETIFMARNMTQQTMLMARNMTQQTISMARNMSTTVVTYIQGPAKDFTMGYVTYVNNTMAGKIQNFNLKQFLLNGSKYGSITRKI